MPGGATEMREQVRGDRRLAFMRMHQLLLPLALLAACGGNDTTTDPDEAASGVAIEASVNKAQNVAEEAREEANATAGQ